MLQRKTQSQNPETQHRNKLFVLHFCNSSVLRFRALKQTIPTHSSCTPAPLKWYTDFFLGSLQWTKPVSRSDSQSHAYLHLDENPCTLGRLRGHEHGLTRHSTKQNRIELGCFIRFVLSTRGFEDNTFSKTVSKPGTLNKTFMISRRFWVKLLIVEATQDSGLWRTEVWKRRLGKHKNVVALTRKCCARSGWRVTRSRCPSPHSPGTVFCTR